MGIGSWVGLWFGLSIPAILLMYLLKRKFIDTPVPSHLLWQRVLRNIEANRPWQKLQHRLLLWLQLLAAALLVFALMQPFWWVHGGSKSHVVIVADISGSMGAVVSRPEQARGAPGTSRLDLLKDKVKQYLQTEAKGSEVTLLATGAEPDVVISREKDKERTSQAVDSLEPFFGHAAYEETLSLAAALTRDDPDAEVVLFTDGEWKGEPRTTFQVPTRTERIDAASVPNVAVQQFGVQHGPEGISAVAVIGETGSLNNRTVGSVEANLYGDEKLLKTISVKLNAKGSATVAFDHLEDAEIYRIHLEAEDGYAADNEAYAFGKKSNNKRILLFTPGNLFLEKALQLTGAEVVKITLDATKESIGQPDGREAAQEKTGEADDAPALPKDNPDLIVIDGDPPSFANTGSWKKLLDNTPLWTIGGSGGEINVGGEQAKPSVHPVMNYVTFSGLYFGKLLDGKAPDWGNAIVQIAGKPAVYAGTEGGYPRLAFQFSLQNTDLPLSAEFPILVNNAVSWLSSSEGSGLGRVTGGKSLEIPIAADTVKGRWVAKGGLALNYKVQPIPADQGKQGVAALQRVPQVPGLYAFEQQNAKGEVIRNYVESAPDAFEGQFGNQGDVVLQFTGADSSLSDQAEGASNDGEAGASGATRKPFEFTWLLAFAVLIVILAEWGVYQRGRSI